MVRDADYVLVFSGGTVMEEGTPDELIAKGGWFYNFANAAEGKESVHAEANAEVELEEEEEVEESEDSENTEI
jgi:ABC-type multidrug transport system ATPase subunit